MTAPRVSVVMPVRDAAPYVEAAVRSILDQQLGDLELVVVDDGSTDITPAILARMDDPRLRVIWQEPTGTTAALNRAILATRAVLVARMDADDVAFPARLSRQVAFLDTHPEVGVLGTACRELGPGGEIRDGPALPTDDHGIRALLPRRNPLVHPTVMIRRGVGDAAGWYDPDVAVAQDYDLWLRVASRTRFANLPEPLLLRRFSAAMTSLARDDQRLATEVRIRWRALRRGDLPPTALPWVLRAALVRALPARVRARRRRSRDDGVGLVYRKLP